MRASSREEVLEYCDNPENSDEDRKAVVEEFYRVNPDYRLKCLWFNSERHNTVRCQQIYKQQSTVKEHCWTQHLKIKRFECEYPGCGRKFKKKQHMSLHWEAKHSGERKYRCDLCHFKFKHNKHLKRHEKCAHQYACRFTGCHLTFINKTGKNSLRLHEDDAHNGQSPTGPFGGSWPEDMDPATMARYSMAMFGEDRKLNPSMLSAAAHPAAASAAAANGALHRAPMATAQQQREALADALAGRHGAQIQAYAAAYIAHLQQYQGTANAAVAAAAAMRSGPSPVSYGGHAAFPSGFHHQYQQYSQAGLNHSLQQTSSTPAELSHLLQQQQSGAALSKARLFAGAHDLSISTRSDPVGKLGMHSAAPTPTAAEMLTRAQHSPQTPTRPSNTQARVYPQSARRATHHATPRSRTTTSSSMSPMHRQRPMFAGERPKSHHTDPASSPVATRRFADMVPTSGASPMAASSTPRVGTSRPRRSASDSDFASPAHKRVKREQMSSPRVRTNARGDIHANVRDPHFHSFAPAGSPGTPTTATNRKRDGPMPMAAFSPSRPEGARYARVAGEASPHARMQVDDIRVNLFADNVPSTYRERAIPNHGSTPVARTNTTSPRHIAPLPVRPNNVTSSPVFDSPPTQHARPMSHAHTHRGNARSSTVYDFDKRRHRLPNAAQTQTSNGAENSPLAHHHRVETRNVSSSRVSNSPLAQHHEAPRGIVPPPHLHRSQSLADYHAKEDIADRFRRSASSPAPAPLCSDGVAPSSSEHFVNSCLGNANEECEYRPKTFPGHAAKRQKTSHRTHDINGVNYVQRSSLSDLPVIEPPRSSSGDESVGVPCRSPAIRRESTDSSVSTASSSNSIGIGMGGDSEREDDTGGHVSVGVGGRKRRFSMFGETPPPLVSNTPEYPLAPSPIIPSLEQ